MDDNDFDGLIFCPVLQVQDSADMLWGELKTGGIEIGSMLAGLDRVVGRGAGIITP
jgi:hypothetical protein